MEPRGHTTKLEKAEEKDPPPIQSAAIQSAAHPLRESNSGGHQWDRELGNTVLRCQPLRFRTRGVMHGSESKQTDNCGLPSIPLSLGLLFFITLFPHTVSKVAFFPVVKHLLHTIYPLTT